MEFFWMILIGMIAGWLAGQFMTGKGFGVIGDIITGMLGALDRRTRFSESGSFVWWWSDRQPDRCHHRRDHLLIWSAHARGLRQRCAMKSYQVKDLMHECVEK
jgi:hypothetical protein